MMWKREDARRLLERTIKMSRARDVIAHLSGGTSRNTRFAASEVTSTGDSENAELNVTVAFGKRHGSSSVNQFDDDTLRRCVESAEEMAQLSPEDPEHMPVLGAQKYGHPAAGSHDPRTAAFGAEERARAVATFLDASATARLQAAGFIETGERFTAVATSAGLFAHDERTRAHASCTFRTGDGTGSGWASGTSNKVADLDFARIARIATEKAQRSAQPTKLDPGDYMVVLEPAAVGEMLSFLTNSLDARIADEGRSFFGKPGGGTRIGEKLLGSFSLVSNPADAAAPSTPFDGQGMPLGKMTWFEDGVLKNLVHSRYWASKQGRTPTGQPQNLILRGSGHESTLEDLIRSTDRGILVTHFFYVRFLEPERVSITGLTRDGTFWIENGQIKRPVNNFRFNQEVVTCLSSAQAWTSPVRVQDTRAVPAIKASGFHFASISDAV